VKAVRYHGRKDIRIENVREPDGYGPNQLLVKPLWTGICGTDLHEYIAGPIVTPATPHVFTAATLPRSSATSSRPKCWKWARILQTSGAAIGFRFNPSSCR